MDARGGGGTPGKDSCRLGFLSSCLFKGHWFLSDRWPIWDQSNERANDAYIDDKSSCLYVYAL